MDVPKHQISSLIDHFLYSSAQGGFLVSCPSVNAENSGHLKGESLVLLGDVLFREREYRRAIHNCKQALQNCKNLPKQIPATRSPLVAPNRFPLPNSFHVPAINGNEMEGIPSNSRTLQMNLLMGKLLKNARHSRGAISCYRECLRHFPYVIEAITALAELGVSAKDVISVIAQTPNRSLRASGDQIDPGRWLQRYA